jgi:hypothetical protein
MLLLLENKSKHSYKRAESRTEKECMRSGLFPIPSDLMSCSKKHAPLGPNLEEVKESCTCSHFALVTNGIHQVDR